MRLPSIVQALRARQRRRRAAMEADVQKAVAATVNLAEIKVLALSRAVGEALSRQSAARFAELHRRQPADELDLALPAHDRASE